MTKSEFLANIAPTRDKNLADYKRKPPKKPFKFCLPKPISLPQIRKMHKFALFRHSRSPKIPQIGISENADWRCFVWQANQQPESFWQQANEPLQAGLRQLQAVGFLQNFAIIRPVPAHYIWRKTVALPFISQPHFIYKQVIAILKQELPLPLEQVYFDFTAEAIPEQQLIKISLFALRKTFAEQFMTSHSTILDCENHCYARACDYLQLKPPEPIDFNQFHFSPEIVDNALYLSALGACLWNGTISI